MFKVCNWCRSTRVTVKHREREGEFFLYYQCEDCKESWGEESLGESG